MASLDALFGRLWDSFRQLNPQADEIHRLLTARGERVVNDHIAFRTVDDPRVDIDVLAKPFVAGGYSPKGEYEFKNKHLFARHFEHADPLRPKIFVSQLKLDEMSQGLKQTLIGLVDQISAKDLRRDDLCAIGRPWNVDFGTYETLVSESEYAGWLSAFGFCANHFTVFVNELTTLGSLAELNQFLKQHGFALNSAGGEIKGSPAEFLEQSSTLAPEIEVRFSDGTHKVPSCYYEFAQRHKTADGKLFTGFVAQSADKIFQSTDRR